MCDCDLVSSLWLRFSLAVLEINEGEITMNKPEIPASVISAPSYYNNANGSLYKVATQRGWNAYLFDLVKRLERGGKKDPLRQEIEKSIVVLQLWLSELGE